MRGFERATGVDARVVMMNHPDAPHARRSWIGQCNSINYQQALVPVTIFPFRRRGEQQFTRRDLVNERHQRQHTEYPGCPQLTRAIVRIELH